MTDFAKWWKELPMGIRIVIIIVAIILVYYAFTYIKSYSATVQQNSQEQAYINQGLTPSFPDAEYESMSNEIVTAISGWGTDEDAVFNVMGRLNNNLDAVKLNQAFGQREGTGLKGWLEGDLSSADIAAMYQILQTNGITYKFK
jgi:hypothetical protein